MGNPAPSVKEGTCMGSHAPPQKDALVSRPCSTTKGSAGMETLFPPVKEALAWEAVLMYEESL